MDKLEEIFHIILLCLCSVMCLASCVILILKQDPFTLVVSGTLFVGVTLVHYLFIVIRGRRDDGNNT